MRCRSSLVFFCVSADFFFDHGIFKSLRISSFLTYHGLLTIVLSIFDYSDSILFMWLITAIPHSDIPYVQIGFIIVLYIFHLFSMLSLELRLVNQYFCLLFIRILSIIDLVCCFHISCVSKWSPRYLTCLVCVMCAPFNDKDIFFYLEVVYNQFSLKIISKLFWRGTITWIINNYRMFDSSWTWYLNLEGNVLLACGSDPSCQVIE